MKTLIKTNNSPNVPVIGPFGISIRQTKSVKNEYVVTSNTILQHLQPYTLIFIDGEDNNRTREITQNVYAVKDGNGLTILKEVND